MKLLRSARVGALLISLVVAFGVLTPIPASAATQLTAITKVKIRAAATTKSKTLGYVEKGGFVTAVRTHKGWTQIRFNGGRAYVAARHLSKRKNIKLKTDVPPGSVRTATKALEVHLGARKSTRVLGVLSDGAHVTMTGRLSNGYGKVVYRGGTGWARLRYLAIIKGVLPRVVGTKVATTKLSIHTTSRSGAETVGRVSKGTRLSVTGVVHNSRAQIIYRNKSRWVVAKYLTTPPTPPPPISGVPRACTSAATDGPRTRPAGAVAVSPSASLPDLIAAHPPGTVFWLAPGTHVFGAGQYTQVIPRDGDTFIGAPGAVIDGRHENHYAFGGNASNVTIRSVTIRGFGSPGDNNNEGVVNHDSAVGWTIESSKIQDNAGAGVMVGSKNRLTGNCLRNNGQYGFNAYHPDGVRDVSLIRNEVAGNNTDDWESRIDGCGCTGGGKFWETRGARITDNYVHDNAGAGLWADTNNTGFLFQNNYISDNDGEGIFYEISYNAEIVNNVFARNGLVNGPKNPGFPTAAIYLSESGSDSRVGGPYNDRLRVVGNQFINNWAGVVAWENADRFAGSPANTSSGTSTLVNPSVATVAACAHESKIGTSPYIDDCRWKTQNVAVEGNQFRFDPSQIPRCAATAGCGANGLFSNYGTYPDWSPYQGTAVEENITFKQNNVWRSNTYVGPWSFVAKEVGNVIDWNAWRAAPYHQDAHSTKK